MQFHPVPALPPLCLPPEILGDISRGIVVRRDYLNIAGAKTELEKERLSGPGSDLHYDDRKKRAAADFSGAILCCY